MKLIREVRDDVKVIQENKNGQKNLYLKGIFLQSEITNHNKRMYPEEIMDNEVKRYIKEKVEKKTALGELGHPDTPKLNLERASHLIVELKKDGTNYLGKAKILPTPFGKTAQSLIEGGARLGVSSRAVGTLKLNEDGIQVVQDDFLLSTAADIVADPSAPDAFVDSIMEGREWAFINGNFVEQDVEYTKRRIRNAPLSQLEEEKLRMFKRFINKL